MLLDLTSKEIEEGMLRLDEEKKKIEEKKIWEEEPANCTMMATEPEGLTTKEDGIPGLQIMGVFTLCGLLVAPGWGGCDQHPGCHSKGVDTKTPQQRRRCEYQHGRGSATQPFKPTVLSFRDERTRWEWPRRGMPAGRGASKAHVWGIPEGQACWGECV
jgi:hypothetical protein